MRYKISVVVGVWGDSIRVGKILEKENISFAGSFGKRIGDESTIIFWVDKWVGNFRL